MNSATALKLFIATLAVAALIAYWTMQNSEIQNPKPISQGDSVTDALATQANSEITEPAAGESEVAEAPQNASPTEDVQGAQNKLQAEAAESAEDSAQLQEKMNQRLAEFPKLLPTLQKYREESKKTGDRVYISQELVLATSELVKYSRSDSDFAKKFGQELSDCASQSKDIPNSVQVYCFQNLQNLATNSQDQELLDLKKKTEAALPPQTKQLNDALDKL